MFSAIYSIQQESNGMWSPIEIDTYDRDKVQTSMNEPVVKSEARTNAIALAKTAGKLFVDPESFFVTVGRIDNSFKPVKIRLNLERINGNGRFATKLGIASSFEAEYGYDSFKEASKKAREFAIQNKLSFTPYFLVAKMGEAKQKEESKEKTSVVSKNKEIVS